MQSWKCFRKLAEQYCANPIPHSIMEAIQVDYCESCTLPTEYCEFGCKGVTKSTASELLPEEKTELGAEQPAAPVTKASKKKKLPEVLISKGKKSKRKFTTVVQGLPEVGVKLNKDLTKALSAKFACGVTISVEAAEKVLLIQGDVMYDLPGFLATKFGVSKDCMFYFDKASGKQRV